MEVQTRPPLVDGLHALRGSPDLGLSVSETDILSDEERELLQSPVEDRIRCLKESIVNGSTNEDEPRDVPTGISSDSPKCNGDVSNESVSDPAEVFRTESDCGRVRGTELVDENSKDVPTDRAPSASPSGQSALGPCEDVTRTDDVVGDSLAAPESHATLNQKPVEVTSKDDKLETNKVPVDTVRESSPIDSNSEVKSSIEGEKGDVDGALSAQLLDSGLSPKSLNDFTGSDLDEMEIPQVIDISSIGVSKENEGDPSSEDVANRVEDETVPSSEIEENGVGKDDASGECVEDKAVHLMVEESIDFDQEEDDSPGYQGMTDDILPIIESELDDIPAGEGNIFDTEVECDDGVSIAEEAEDALDDPASILPDDIDIADNDASQPVSESCQTADNDISEECSTKKNLNESGSSSAHVKLKRRASAGDVSSPPRKILKGRSSLDNLKECAEILDKVGSLEELKKPPGKNPLEAPTKISSEPLDIPVEIDEDEPVVTPAKIKKLGAVADPSKTGTKTAQDEQPSKDKEDSVMVIDLDDYDKEVPASSAGESQPEVAGEEEPSKSAPRSALDVLFNGKREITLNRKMFTRIMKSYVSQYLLTFSELGKTTSLSLKANNVLTRIQSNVKNYERQKDDFKSIMSKLIEDRQVRKTWDETLVPPRATRSVGLQVCSVGSIYVKNAANSEGTVPTKPLVRSKMPSPSSHQSQALAQQKQAFAQQQIAMAQSRSKQVEQTTNVRPIAKKSVTPTNRPMVISTVPATKLVTSPKPKATSQFPVVIPKLNGIKALSVTRNPEPSGPPNSTPLTVTTVSPNSRALSVSSKGTFTLKSPQNRPIQIPSPLKTSNTVLSKALSSPGLAARGNPMSVAPKAAGTQNSSKSIPVAVTHTPSPLQNSKTLTSGPGRPGKTPVSSKKSSSAPETTIDLTDLDDDAPQPTKPPVMSNTTARKSTSSASRVAATTKVPNVGLSSKQMRHPTLPPNPPNFNPSTAPPRPYLGICDTQTVTQGIMLTWHFNNIVPNRKISKFQVFAYQETKGDGEDAWKKVGDVDALPLPMACTLTQFREGYTYHFIVRALDETGNVGPFSAPNTITLMKKTV